MPVNHLDFIKIVSTALTIAASLTLAPPNTLAVDLSYVCPADTEPISSYSQNINAPAAVSNDEVSTLSCFLILLRNQMMLEKNLARKLERAFHHNLQQLNYPDNISLPTDYPLPAAAPSAPPESVLDNSNAPVCSQKPRLPVSVNESFLLPDGWCQGSGCHYCQTFKRKL